MTFKSTLFVSLMVVVASCGEPPTEDVCEPGRQEECTCPGGSESLRDCRSDGSGWDECDCDTVTESCSDGLMNQNETDVDCRGSCLACPDGSDCFFDSDCQGGNCYNGNCASAPDIEVTPLRLDFGGVNVNSSFSLDLTVANHGGAPLVVMQDDVNLESEDRDSPFSVAFQQAGLAGSGVRR